MSTFTDRAQPAAPGLGVPGSPSLDGDTPALRLFALLELISDGGPRPAAIIGIPVGFVGSAESKLALVQHPDQIPYLVVHGRRGGSALCASALNALAREDEL